MMELIREIEKEFLVTDRPEVRPGDEVALHLKVVEGGKERLQVFRGTVISLRGRGTGRTIMVRKVSHGEGVERGVLLNSPALKKLELIKAGGARRARLYHLRRRH